MGTSILQSVDRLCAAALFSLILVGAPRVAQANTQEDIQGISARANAMGGGMTAAADDFSAAYYNPAALSRCRGTSFSFDVRHSVYNLDASVPAGDIPTIFVPDPANPDELIEIDDPFYTPEEPRDLSRITVGLCSDLPAGLSAGLVFGFGLQNPLVLDMSTLSAAPNYALYGEPLEQLTIGFGLGYEITDWLAIGAGASMLIRSDILVGTEFNLLNGAAAMGPNPPTSAVDFVFDIKPSFTPYVGLLLEPMENLQIGLAYRGELEHRLEAPIIVDVDFVGIQIPLDLNLALQSWYTPHQLALGGNYTPIPNLNLVADLTWYRLSQHPGPFVQARTDIALGDVSVLYLDDEDLGFRDVVVLRAGGEYIHDDRLAIRGGYSYRPSSMARPGTTRDCRARAADANARDCVSSTYDGDLHSVSTGLGYHFGLLERPATQGERDENGDPPLLSRAYADIAFYGRMSFMPSDTVRRGGSIDEGVLPTVRYGGTIFDLGLTVTAGWY